MATTKALSEMSREVISIGMNFAPLQIDLGDGKIWKLDSDPSPAAFGALQRSLTQLGSAGKAMERGEEIDFGAGVQEVSEAIRELLVETKQKTEWTKVGYGFSALTKLAEAYIPALMGTPTK